MHIAVAALALMSVMTGCNPAKGGAGAIFWPMVSWMIAGRR
jgi:hypothetical protein